MAFKPKTKRKWRKADRFECCEVCGWKAPRLENKGLLAAHIISNGPEDAANVLFLCHSCEEVFDRFLKPVIAKAFECSNQKKGTAYMVPENWIRGEGRRAKGDVI
jgi:hypothetical protein